MKITFTSSKGFKRAVTAVTAAAIMTTTFTGFAASADNSAVPAGDAFTVSYNGHEVIKRQYSFKDVENEFTYSDYFFDADPKAYNPSLATMSCIMTEASSTYKEGSDYSKGAQTITDILGKIGFGNIFVNADYKAKPTADSIGCVIASKKAVLGGKDSYIVSVTVRSAEYEKEWVSNVTLGTKGEAKGFSDSASKLKKYVDEYISSHKELKNAAADGRAAIWFQGFSRGGAVANLTAKRCIDEYTGTPVFAYCIAAPQGGISSEERSDRDYRSIHNVINVNDIVPYVGPSYMGFKRYGVDHYVGDSSINEKELLKGRFFVNNLSDNNGYVQAAAHKLELVKKHIRSIAGAKSESVMPYNVQNKRLDIGLHIPKIENASSSLPTYRVISNFFNTISVNLSRSEYVSSGLQDAVGRLVSYVFSGADVASLKNKLNKDKFISDTVKQYFLNRLVSVHPFTFLCPPAAITKMLMINTDDLISAAQGALSTNSELKAAMNNYTGGFGQALKDIGLIAKYALKGFKNLDELVTFFLNVGNITHNHEFKQYIGWLRAADPWYEGEAVTAEHMDENRFKITCKNENAEDVTLAEAA
ncbi:Lipase (class 3) [Ruminococcaceae bacterium FB2012]|nr:Lipase (class 3) [Ruminococcaceae bacterium FB2012]